MNSKPQNPDVHRKTFEQSKSEVQSWDSDSSLLSSAVRMFPDVHRDSSVRCFFAVALSLLAAFSTPAWAAATPPVSESTDDVRRSIQDLLKADAAAMATDPASMHVQVPKPPPALPAPVKKPAAPATKPAVVAVKPPPTTQGAADLELDTLRHSKVGNPLAAADGFFKAGRLVEAAILYEQALQDAHARDKDWALLQLGACKEQSDPQAALAQYARLLAECPNSTWRRLATARQGALQWLIAQDVPNLLKNAVPGKIK
jgi:tetratricopeptide (TPR) repeat protein